MLSKIFAFRVSESDSRFFEQFGALSQRFQERELLKVESKSETEGAEEAAGLAQQARGEDHGDAGRGEGDGREVSNGKSLNGFEDTEEHQAAQESLAGDEEPRLGVSEPHKAGAVPHNDGAHCRQLETAAEEEELPGGHSGGLDIEQLYQSVARQEMKVYIRQTGRVSYQQVKHSPQRIAKTQPQPGASERVL